MSNKKDKTPAEAEPRPEFVIRTGEGLSTPCARCCQHFTCSGPTGYRAGEPICDGCLVEGNQELGMVLALVSVVRAYGRVRPGISKQHMDALHELGAFARVYETFAAKSGPARLFRIPGFTDHI